MSKCVWRRFWYTEPLVLRPCLKEPEAGGVFSCCCYPGWQHPHHTTSNGYLVSTAGFFLVRRVFGVSEFPETFFRTPLKVFGESPVAMIRSLPCKPMTVSLPCGRLSQ